MKRLRAVVSGRVQGVGYRASVHNRLARLAGVTGYVKNLPDGTVEIIAEGADETLVDVLYYAGEGSVWSSVEKVETEYSEATGEYKDFTIAY